MTYIPVLFSTLQRLSLSCPSLYPFLTPFIPLFCIKCHDGTKAPSVIPVFQQCFNKLNVCCLENKPVSTASSCFLACSKLSLFSHRHVRQWGQIGGSFSRPLLFTLHLACNLHGCPNLLLLATGESGNTNLPARCELWMGCNAAIRHTHLHTCPSCCTGDQRGSPLHGARLSLAAHESLAYSATP